MSDRHTRVTTESWGSRLGGSLKGILFGLILIVVAFPLLWWNEGRTVERHRALEEGAGVVLPVMSEAINQGAEGRLIHTTGTAVTQEVLADPLFGLAVRALQLRRTVSMFQWQEQTQSQSEKNLGGSETTTTTYTYRKGWSDALIDSSRFEDPEGHDNPTTMPYPSQDWTAQEARLGAFRLTPEQVGLLDNHQPASLAEARLPTFARPHRVQGNEIFVGLDPANPQLGDLRILFTQMPETPMSIIARQVKGGLAPYQTQSGGQVMLVKGGTHDAEAMFHEAESENQLIAWLVRAAGLLLMHIGLALLMRPLSVLADVVPFIGGLVALGTGTAAFLVALSLTLGVIALAWVFYRPFFAAALIAVAVVAGVVLVRRGRRASGVS